MLLWPITEGEKKHTTTLQDQRQNDFEPIKKLLWKNLERKKVVVTHNRSETGEQTNNWWKTNLAEEAYKLRKGRGNESKTDNTLTQELVKINIK